MGLSCNVQIYKEPMKFGEVYIWNLNETNKIAQKSLNTNSVLLFLSYMLFS